MPNLWTIHHHEVHGDKDKTDLVGCHIKLNPAGTAYQFTEPNINNVLSTTIESSPPTPPTPPFDFPHFHFGNPLSKWHIHVSTLTGGKHHDKAEGTWENTDPTIINDETGTWTAQAGSGLAAFGDEDAAAAAGYA